MKRLRKFIAEGGGLRGFEPLLAERSISLQLYAKIEVQQSSQTKGPPVRASLWQSDVEEVSLQSSASLPAVPLSG